MWSCCTHVSCIIVPWAYRVQKVGNPRTEGISGALAKRIEVLRGHPASVQPCVVCETGKSSDNIEEHVWSDCEVHLICTQSSSSQTSCIGGLTGFQWQDHFAWCRCNAQLGAEKQKQAYPPRSNKVSIVPTIAVALAAFRLSFIQSASLLFEQIHRSWHSLWPRFQRCHHRHSRVPRHPVKARRMGVQFGVCFAA